MSGRTAGASSHRLMHWMNDCSYGVFSRELAMVETLAPRNSLIDCRAVPLEFVRREQVRHHDEAVAPELRGVRCELGG